MSVYELILGLGEILLSKSYCNFFVIVPKLYLPIYTISQSIVSQPFPDGNKLKYDTYVPMYVCLHKQGSY
jgi:hypothetical protein